MPTVFIPALLRPRIGVARVEVEGATVGELLTALGARYPGVYELLVEDDDIKPGIAITVNDQLTQEGLFEPVPDDAEVHILPALSGGC